MIPTSLRKYQKYGRPHTPRMFIITLISRILICQLIWRYDDYDWTCKAYI